MRPTAREMRHRDSRPVVALMAAGELWGGVERFVHILAEQLLRHGVSVNVILFHTGLLLERLRRNGVPASVVPAAHKYDPRAVRWVHRFIKEHGINVMHVHGYKATVVGGLAGMLAGIRLVKTEHGRLEPFTGIGFMKMKCYHVLDRLISRAFLHSVVFVSKDIQDRSGPTYPHLPHRVIYNGIEPRELKDPLLASSTPPGMNTEQFNIAIVARLSEIKGHRVLLGAMGRLRDIPQLQLYVFGSGPLEQEFVGYCRRQKLENVRFMGFRDDVLECLRHASLLVMPSLHEGLPYALLEAMHVGVPVVASAVGGLREIVTHGRDGILVPPGDEDALAGAIRELYHDVKLRRTLARNAHRTVREHFLADHMSDRYRQVYEEVLSHA